MDSEEVSHIQVGGRTVLLYEPSDDKAVLVVKTYPSRNFRRDHFGRVVVDTCSSDHAHLTAPAVEGKERPGCRELIDTLFEQFAGKRGTMTVSIRFSPEET